ncbi:MAG: TRAP transporter permease [Alphaproteobacteria bacterium]
MTDTAPSHPPKSAWPATFAARAITAFAAAMAIFHLVIAVTGPPEELILRTLHLGFAAVLIFALYPALPRRAAAWRVLLDLAPLAIVLAALAHLLLNYEYVVTRFIYVDDLTPADLWLGTALIVVLLEATRRVIGPALPITAALFLGYALLGPWLPFGMRHDGFALYEIVEELYMTTNGVFGIPLNVSATYVVLFVLFGTFLERVGTGELFMAVALALTGSSPGGPAKVACVTSGFFGTVSGSAVSNVMTTGALTIPLMKRIGYRPAFAGAVEAVASTGGQIMPPIMGAAAFVMAEFLGVSFLTVAGYALIPAVLFYVAVFMAIHFEAKRVGLRGLPRAELPDVGAVMIERGHLFLPLAVIIGVLLSGYSAPMAAFWGVVSILPVAMLRPATRKTISPAMIFDALASGARNALPVAAACACAGIVIGVISLTGIGLSFTTLVLDAAQESLWPALVLTMIAGIILGMGMPTTPAYIMQVALLVPALVKLDVPVAAAHMFVFYFAILSSITPPVAMAVFAANSISGAKLMPSSLAAVKLGATGYLVPYLFVFAPALLMIGGAGEIAVAVITGIIGVTCLAGALHGWFVGPANWWQRIALFVAAIALLMPSLWTTLVGGGILVAVVLAQRLVSAR